MSQNHNPPRQNVHRGRQPTTYSAAHGKQRVAKITRTNAAFNAAALRASGPARGATPGQLAATIKLS
jgi:hypothetical protein